MPLNKKIIISITISIFFVSSLSGCVIQNLIFGTSFSIKSWEVTDDDGFPAISYSFACSGYVNVKMYNTNSQLMDTDYFFTDDEQTLFLGSYKETLPTGKYTMKAYDSDGEEISSESFTFTGSNLTISSCEQKWWVQGSDKILLGLRLRLINNGDVPVYPYNLDLEDGDSTSKGLVLPDSVLPGETNSVDCVLYKKGSPNEDSFNLILKDIEGNTLASGIFDFNVENNVPTAYFTEGIDKKLSVPNPDFLVTYYSNLDRGSEEDYSYYVYDIYDDYYIDIFIDRMISTLPFGQMKFDAKTKAQQIDFLTKIVQYLPYEEDTFTGGSTEYPNFPIETIFFRTMGCDCEDKSILVASLLDHVGFNVSLMRLPNHNHMAVGVNLSEDDVPRYPEYKFYTPGYFYLETTTEDAPIGFVPSQFTNPSELEVYRITNRPYIFHSWVGNVFTIYNTDEYVKLEAIVENQGRATAYNVKLEGVFVTLDEINLNYKESTISSLEPGMKKKVTLFLDIPKAFTSVFRSNVYLNGKVVDTKESLDTLP